MRLHAMFQRGARATALCIGAVLVAEQALLPLSGLAQEVRRVEIRDGVYHFKRPIWGDRRALGDDWNHGYRGWHPLYGEGVRPVWKTIDQTHRITIDNNYYNRDFQGWNPAWRNRGFWGSRPWRAGWYSWTPNRWSWWNNNSIGWGLASLAAGSVITSLINHAADQRKTVIVVPGTDMQLNYGSVEAVGNHGASFTYELNGVPLMGAANCQLGLLGGQMPTTTAQAQLLNAVCHVAYGSGV